MQTTGGLFLEGLVQRSLNLDLLLSERLLRRGAER